MLLSCSDTKKTERPLFENIPAEVSGLDFKNELSFSQEFNVYKYRNYYNGGGVAIGDINNDGLSDVYMTANLKKNQLFLNKGDLKFENISTTSMTEGQKAWSTGVTMVDINADGFLDIYVCNSGDIKGDNKQNELFINNGDLTFTESAEKYGLADEGFSTHASFFDYDKDGDLDVYLLNNSYQAIGSFNLSKNERPNRDKKGGDKLLENQDGVFVDVSEQAGIYGSVIGFGLGVTVGDVNGDGWEDIYISNDFFERDYLYINNKDKTFSESLTNSIQSICGASMGADMADINNDGAPDIFVTEMLPSDPERLKSVTTFENWDRHHLNLKNGYHHQFTRNTLQLNNKDKSFHEIGRFAGVEASDWSWGALIFDMNNDGFKDLFIANGIYQDLTNQDYLQYIANEEVIKSIVSEKGVNYKKLIEIIPSNPVPNHAYLNNGNLKFEKQGTALGLNTKGFSNGAAYGDLDNDGDLDLVVNNVNMESWLYKNNSVEIGQGNYIGFYLKGSKLNPFAVGAQVTVKDKNGNQFYIENQPTRGFQSSMDTKVLMGLKDSSRVNIEIKWTDGSITTLDNIAPNQYLEISNNESVEPSLQGENYKGNIYFTNKKKMINTVRQENEFVDFDKERLIYHKLSTQGHRISKGDVNADGVQDIFIGGSKGFSGEIYLNTNGQYSLLENPAFVKDKISEDMESIFFDVDNDGDLDLYVCSGGFEFSRSSSALTDRLYINDGNAQFSKSKQLLPSTKKWVSTSSVVKLDLDNNGYEDLIVAENYNHYGFGKPGSLYLLMNENGTLSNKTESLTVGFEELGMINDIDLMDFDKDGDKDLVVTGKFMGIELFENDNGRFKKVNTSINKKKGYWNTLKIQDINGDGKEDIIAGNLGLNSRFKVNKETQIAVYIDDFDGNGSIDPLFVESTNNFNRPMALRHDLIEQMPGIKKKLPSYDVFKTMSIEDVFGEEAIHKARKLEINDLASYLFLNKGNKEFEAIILPNECQFTTIFAIETHDFDKDGDMDILLGGNLEGVKPEIGKYDASRTILLLNEGKGNFKVAKNSGIDLKGEVRDFEIIGNTIFISLVNDYIYSYDF